MGTEEKLHTLNHTLYFSSFSFPILLCHCLTAPICLESPTQLCSVLMSVKSICYDHQLVFLFLFGWRLLTEQIERKREGHAAYRARRGLEPRSTTARTEHLQSHSFRACVQIPGGNFRKTWIVPPNKNTLNYSKFNKCIFMTSHSSHFTFS